MNGYEVYKNYCALKSHFTLGSDYNFIKYKGKTRAKFSTYEKRRDKAYFEYLANRYSSGDIVPFLLANFINDATGWIGDFTNDFDEAENKYLAWRKKFESLTMVFTDDIKNIRSMLEDKEIKFIDLFDVTKQKHPAIFRFLLYNMISLETFIILNDIGHFYSVFDEEFSEDPLWIQWKFKCERYRPFLPINQDKYKEILKSLFT